MGNKEIILGHLKQAKSMWDDEKTDTPGGSFEEFMTQSYGPGVAQHGKGKQTKPQASQGPLQRYVGYLMPSKEGGLRPTDKQGVPQDTALAGNIKEDQYV